MYSIRLHYLGWMSKFGKKWAKKYLVRKSAVLFQSACSKSDCIFPCRRIWHGAAWKYIVYGMYNGIIIAFSGIMADNYRSWKKETEYFR